METDKEGISVILQAQEEICSLHGRYSPASDRGKSRPRSSSTFRDLELKSTSKMCSVGSKALGDIDGAMVYRNVVPQKIWKLQKWLQIGTEKKLVNELRIVDYVLYRFISSRRDELRRSEAKAGDRLDV
ncbi:hypothetical protein V6N12_063470 [Hibiscus sabdariffa]|uniref:Uncharacterized protein n=1 Tax=Hibiscus sabdariffa TaxID=183260 RepID=A0ABR2FBV1_9ROSI